MLEVGVVCDTDVKLCTLEQHLAPDKAPTSICEGVHEDRLIGNIEHRQDTRLGKK